VIDDHLAARDVEENAARDAADREIAGNLVVVERVTLDLGGLERDRRVVRDIEELARTNMRRSVARACRSTRRRS
jgi:hypothetical protein